MLGQLHTIAPPTTSNQTLNRENATKYNDSARLPGVGSFPTWENSVRYPGGRDDPEILSVKNTVSPIWFDQEYGAKFTALTGSIYEEWSEDTHVYGHEEDSLNERYNPAYTNHLAMDYGFNNPFVALDIQIDPRLQHMLCMA